VCLPGASATLAAKGNVPAYDDAVAELLGDRVVVRQTFALDDGAARRDRALLVLAQKAPPGGDGIHRPTRGLADVDAELEQFPMDARCTPQRIGVTHAPDQITSFWTDPVAIPDDVIANANRTGNPCDATQSRLRA
jgi:hypothetical protein